MGILPFLRKGHTWYLKRYTPKTRAIIGLAMMSLGALGFWYTR